ncbi:MAG: nucleotidyltransferase family protein [Limisphaerales bacterium]
MPSTPTISAASRLLELLWTGKPPGPAAGLPTSEADWQRVLALAARHSLAPLLAAEVLGRSDLTIPAAVTVQLTAMRERAARRALAQIAELLRVQAALQREEIPVLKFKGQLLAEQAYGDVSLRSCFDLDLFVHEADVLRAKQVLLMLGYRAEFTLLAHEEADLLRIECEYPFKHATNGIQIDLQWRPRARYFSFPLPAEELWQRSIKTTLAGHPVMTFAPEDLTLLLLVHGAKHTWNKLEQLCALAAWLERNPGLDWAAIERRAEATGARRILLLGVHLLATWFAPPVPETLASAAANDSRVLELAQELSRIWFTPEPAHLGVLPTLRLHLRMRERLADRVRHCFWLAVTPGVNDWQAFSLPPALHALHYCLRPLRLVSKRHAEHHYALRA